MKSDLPGKSPQKLPSGWRWAKLGDVLNRRTEIIHPKDKPSGRDVFVGLHHVESGTGVRTGADELDLAALSGRKPRFYKGDIVYGYLRPYLNKVWIAEFDGLCSVDQYAFEVDTEQVDTEFISAFMRSPVYLERAPVNGSPGQLPRIRSEEVAEVPLLLPPLPEQQRIASLLKKQMAAVKRARALVLAQIEDAQALTAAYLREAFPQPGDKLPKEWQRGKLCDFCKIYQPKTISFKDISQSPGIYEVFGANGVIGHYSAYNHEEPEVLITCRGATCGSVNISNAKSWITGNSMVVHPVAGDLTKDFLYWVLKTIDLPSMISGSVSGGLKLSFLRRFEDVFFLL